jgi:hypothetical protein
MKRIEFVLPVESMRGNLSGEQTLVYAQNNNSAYEAPNGTQYARNYQGRYIGSKVSKSGLKYFNVKTKSATVLNDSTRLTMGTLAGVAAIRSALMKDHAQDYAQIIANLVIEVTQGIISGTGKRTVMSLFYEKVAAMLQTHADTCTFAGSTPVVLKNPWTNTAAPAGAISVTISNALWIKYAPLFFVDDNIIGGAYFRINGMQFFAPYADGTTLCTWLSLKSSYSNNANMVLSTADILAEGDGPTYQEKKIGLGSVAWVDKTSNIVANGKYFASVPVD